MLDFLIVAFVVLFFGAYIYFGYYQDYKRNPKEFIRSIVGMPIGILANLLGLKSIEEKLKQWANNSTKKPKRK